MLSAYRVEQVESPVIGSIAVQVVVESIIFQLRLGLAGRPRTAKRNPVLFFIQPLTGSAIFCEITRESKKKEKIRLTS